MTPTPPLPQHVWDALPTEAQGLILAMQLQIETMRLQIDAFGVEIRALQSQLATNSRNSSKPPSSDPIHIKRQPPKPPSGNKPGG